MTDIATPVLAVLTIIAAAALNRVTGGGFLRRPPQCDGDWLLKPWLPGKPVLWTAPALGLLSLPWLGWTLAPALALAYGVSRGPLWGPYMPMGRMAWVAVRGAFDAAIRSISFGSQRLAMFWRFTATAPAILPLAWLTGLWALPAIEIAALWLSYEAGWVFYERFRRADPGGGVPYAELLAGAVWGAITIAIWGYGHV